MRTPTRSSFIGTLSALVLVLGSITPLTAQDPSPEPSASPAAIESSEERRAEGAARRWERAVERAAQREGRAALRELAKARRADAREERKAEREERKAERRAQREERRAGRAETRDERRAAWAEVRVACRVELEAIRESGWDDRDALRAAWREARSACRGAFVASAQDRADEPAIDERYTDAAAGAGASGVVRTDLGLAEPASAEGQQLGLWHYLIPAGEELAPHTHPGWQLARITAGELEYTVLEGEGVLLRADGSREAIGPGTYALTAGDGVIENPQLVHRGANRTDEPVTLISATLFEADEPLSTVVED